MKSFIKKNSPGNKNQLSNLIRVGSYYFALSFLFVFILIATFTMPKTHVAHSQTQGQYTLLEPLPCIPGTGQDCGKDGLITNVNVETFIKYIFSLSMAIAVLLAVIMIFWGGFEYVTSEIPGVKSDGKSRIQNAILGLIMVLASYLIINTIDPRLTKIELGLPKIINLTTYNPYDLDTLAERTALQNIAKYAEDTRHEVEAMIKKSDSLLAKATDLENQAKGSVDPEERIRLTKEAEQARAEGLDLRVSSVKKVIEGSNKIHADNIDRIIGNSSYTGKLSADELKQIQYEKGRINATYDSEISLLNSYGKADEAEKLRSEKTLKLIETNDNLFAQQTINARKSLNPYAFNQDITGTGAYSKLVPSTTFYSARQIPGMIADNLDKYSGGLEGLTEAQRKQVLDNRKVLANKIREETK